jgi:hypothetical protein
MMSETMIGFDVAPEAPRRRLLSTSFGSIESSQTFVPEAMSDRIDMRAESFPVGGALRRCSGIVAPIAEATKSL